MRSPWAGLAGSRSAALDGEGERLLATIVDSLKEAGITADIEITEARHGHTDRKILAVADEHSARMIALGSCNRTDLPHIPFDA